MKRRGIFLFGFLLLAFSLPGRAGDYAVNSTWEPVRVGVWFDFPHYSSRGGTMVEVGAPVGAFPGTCSGFATALGGVIQNGPFYGCQTGLLWCSAERLTGVQASLLLNSAVHMNGGIQASVGLDLIQTGGGVQCAFCNVASRAGKLLQLGLWNQAVIELKVFQLALVNVASDFGKAAAEGCRAFQGGIVNCYSDAVNAVQVGLWNSTKNGSQTGLINVSEGESLQVGLLNYGTRESTQVGLLNWAEGSRFPVMFLFNGKIFN